MPTIIPIKDLKDTAKVSDLCHSSQEPVFITKNGYGDMVMMSMETYDQIRRRERIYSDIEISEQQIKSGQISDARKALSSLKERYGL